MLVGALIVTNSNVVQSENNSAGLRLYFGAATVQRAEDMDRKRQHSAASLKHFKELSDLVPIRKLWFILI